MGQPVSGAGQATWDFPQKTGSSFQWRKANETISRQNSPCVWCCAHLCGSFEQSASASSLRTAATSPGAIPGDVLINEFIATPTGSEAVEIGNTTDAEIDIGGWTMDGSAINAGVVVPANGYVVLDVKVAPGLGISNGGEVLELVDDGAVTIDQVGYGDDGGAPKPEYNFATARVPDCATIGDDAADWNIDESPLLAPQTMVQLPI